MSSTYSTIAILDPHTQISKHKLTIYQKCPVQSQYYIPPPICGSHNTAQYVQRYHYIDHMSSLITTRSHHPRAEHTLLPNLSSPFSTLVPTSQGWNTYYWPHLHYIDSYYYIIDPTTQQCKKNIDRISFKSSPVTVLDPTITCEWHNTNYMSCMSSPITIPDPTTHMWNTTLTTCPICSVLSLC